MAVKIPEANELISERFEKGRIERDLGVGEPFQWDHEIVGMDEAEELADAFIYRTERYKLWYGKDREAWPSSAHTNLGKLFYMLVSLLADLEERYKNGSDA